MPTESAPFDDIRRLITSIPAPDEAAVNAVRERDRELTKPAGERWQVQSWPLRSFYLKNSVTVA